MALPLTEEAMARMIQAAHELLKDPVRLQAQYNAFVYGQDRFWTFFSESRHQYVRYDASVDRVVLENPDTFYFADCSPSSSRWMVPGS